MSAVAEFRSKCASCGNWIEEGDPITRDDDGEWIHEDCADDPRDLHFNLTEEANDG